ncbi:FAS1-like dehydratase domain-containing protein [Pseudonocardia thermophila]|uniref:FAS1-like dehydratase domain-containing protein n=1 Tax=Pseudonocardia thermophila TaxID=1848 RepID=UPI00248F1F0A|nr:MaoC family dehydratase N-terminal domain-containing protein [Pseudonocardia thermophila]
MSTETTAGTEPAALVGRAGAPFPVRIEHGKVAEFARAVGIDPAELAGSDGEPVPPATFLTTARLWSGPANDPWTGAGRNRSRVLHGEQEFVFHGRCPRVGETLTATSRIESVFEKSGRRGGTLRFSVTVTEFRDAAGTLVAEARSTGIETSRAATG